MTSTVAAPPQREVLSRRVAALVGLASGLLAFGAAELVAALTGPSSEPLVAVGDAFVDLTPPGLKDFATSTFGTSDKLVLLGGAAVVLAALSDFAGVVAARGRFRGPWVVLALGTIAAIAALSRPDATILSVLPSAAATIVGTFVLSALVDRLETASRPGLGPDRRTLLRTVGIVGGSGAVALAAGRLLASGTRDAEASRATVRLPAPADREPPLPLGVEVGVAGVTRFRVAAGDFYRIDTALVVPRVRAEDWQLRIHGLVDREVRLDFATLLAGRLVERDVTLACVSNEVGGDLIGNATWLGLPIGPLLRQAGPRPGAGKGVSARARRLPAAAPP